MEILGKDFAEMRKMVADLERRKSAEVLELVRKFYSAPDRTFKIME